MGGHGAALVGVRASETRQPFEDVRLVSVSDLAISAKMSLFGSLVWVTRLSDGSPVPRASVAVRDAARVIATATTDADGFASFPRERLFAPESAEAVAGAGRIVVARAGDDWTWRSASDTVGWADLEGPGPMGMLFTERGIYKAGETIRLAGIFRIRRPPRGTAKTPGG